MLTPDFKDLYQKPARAASGPELETVSVEQFWEPA